MTGESRCRYCGRYYDHRSAYCSDFCRKQALKRIFMTGVPLALLTVVAFMALLSIARSDLPYTMPSEASIAEIRAEYAGQTCPVCNGTGLIDCPRDIGGNIVFMGYTFPDTACGGDGTLVCPVCDGTGVVPIANRRKIDKPRAVR